MLFTGLALLVRDNSFGVVDEEVRIRLQILAPAWLYQLGLFLSLVGGLEVEALLAVALGVLLIVKRRPRLAGALALVFAVAAVEVLVKYLIPLPGAAPSEAQSQSLAEQVAGMLAYGEPGAYPSGHVARATFLLGLLFLGGHRVRERLPRLALQVLPAGFAALMGLTRLVLPNEHLLSEVVGGYLLGLAALPLASWLLGPAQPRRSADGSAAGTLLDCCAGAVLDQGA